MNRLELMLTYGLSMTRRNSHAVLTGLTDDASYVRPLNLGRLWTRHMAGVREAERDRRRHG